MVRAPYPAGLRHRPLPLLPCGPLLCRDLSRYGGFFPGNGHAQVGVILLPGARLGRVVTSAGSMVAGTILVVPAIRVVVWRHVGVTRPVGSHRTSPPSRSTGRY